MTDYKRVCEEAARAGGAVLLEKLGKVQAREKAPADLVTEADLASQERVSQVLLDAFPSHGVLGEEDVPDSQGNNSSDYRWIIDPLDGTTNFVHGVPHFCVSVALQHGSQVLVGAVFNPISKECYTAAAAGGAFLDGRPIHTSRVWRLSESLCAIGFPPGVQGDTPDLQAFLSALPECQALRRTGSAALNLCYVAAGRFDAAWSFATKIWDMAAGTLLVSEAGGIVTPPDDAGECLESGHFLACSTAELHKSLLPLIGGQRR
ncbi:MAG: inositol monophosphatase family protein [Planctomycetota bacterium]|nr:inositol monophosphatase family protein [Planctomycetota bacterium]